MISPIPLDDVRFELSVAFVSQQNALDSSAARVRSRIGTHHANGMLEFAGYSQPQRSHVAEAAHTVDELVAMVARLERKLDAALRAPPKFLSKRAAAKMLGVDRGTTLERWIRSGALRVLEGRIPLPDVERLVANGPPALPTRRRSAPRATRADDASAIRELEV